MKKVFGTLYLATALMGVYALVSPAESSISHAKPGTVCESCKESRNTSARRAFVRANPCPATQKAGACPGYEVDHIKSLVCGGKNEVANLQWLTIKDHRAKTKQDMKQCKMKGLG